MDMDVIVIVIVRVRVRVRVRLNGCGQWILDESAAGPMVRAIGLDLTEVACLPGCLSAWVRAEKA
jgi:hypothetical protein